jgi:hypothetical protein
MILPSSTIQRLDHDILEVFHPDDQQIIGPLLVSVQIFQFQTLAPEHKKQAFNLFLAASNSKHFAYGWEFLTAKDISFTSAIKGVAVPSKYF